MQMTKHILLVDDDGLLRRSLAFNLEQAGYRTSTAANAEDANATGGGTNSGKQDDSNTANQDDMHELKKDQSSDRIHANEPK